MKPETIFRLRPLTSGDVEAAIALDQGTLGGLWTAQGYQQEIGREQGICLGITTQSSALVAMGFAWVVLDEVHIISIAVESGWQGRGLGSLLLSQLIQQAAQQECHHATLEVQQSNTAAIALYQKFHFHELGVRTDYYGKGQHAFILWLNQIQRPDYLGFLRTLFRLHQLKLHQTGIVLVNELGCTNG